MSLVNCPACGAEMSMDVVFTHDELRRAMHEVMLISFPLATLVLRYLGLFRPAKNRLSPLRMAKLAAQLVPDMQRGAITHKGRDWTMPLEGWRAGLEAMLEKAAAQKITLPLENHNYLYSVLVGLADKVEAHQEREHEQGQRGRTHQAGPLPVGAVLDQLQSVAPKADAVPPIPPAPVVSAAPKSDSPTVRAFKAELAARKGA